MNKKESPPHNIERNAALPITVDPHIGNIGAMDSSSKALEQQQRAEDLAQAIKLSAEIKGNKLREGEEHDGPSHRKDDRRDLRQNAENGKDPQRTVASQPLTPKEQDELKIITAHIEERKKFALPALLHGNMTAVEYDGKIGNFSTWTSIQTLQSGRKVFVIYNYPLSIIHRFLDNMMKGMTNTKVKKSASGHWAETFIERSNIPVLWSDHKRLVVLPYIPNINLYDLFANNHEIADWGECQWAKEITVEQKLEIIREIIEELKKIHKAGKTWGETILPNMIRSQEGKVIICDPETQYDAHVSLTEQKARDLKDIIMSICGSLAKSEHFDDFGKIIEIVENAYGDPEVFHYLRTQLTVPMTMSEKVFYAYTGARLGISRSDFKKVLSILKITEKHVL